MRRADRLFEIIQLMRRQKLVRAPDLAEKLEVSERTIYRDVRDLIASRVPIEGEAGVGYALRQGFDLPPLMFDEHEIEALVLGARIIEVLDRCEAGRCRRQRDRQGRGGDPGAPAPAHGGHRPARPVPPLRRADHGRSQRAAPGAAAPAQGPLPLPRQRGSPTARAVRPLALFFYGPVWLLAAWCELRQDFRSFRLDRMSELAVLDERFGPERGKTIQDFLKRDDQ